MTKEERIFTNSIFGSECEVFGECSFLEKQERHSPDTFLVQYHGLETWRMGVRGNGYETVPHMLPHKVAALVKE